MDYDKDKVDEAVLALLHLTRHADEFGSRAWKGHDWDALDRLYENGLISSPRSKAKSVALTDEGETASEAAFRKLFGKDSKQS